MNNEMYDFGLIGLGTMGKNLLLNISEKGYTCLGFDTNAESVESLNNEDSNAVGVNDIEAFVAQLSAPRKILMLVPAGEIVDTVIESLQPYLEAGDILMDGGNSFFADTERRQAQLTDAGINYLSVGISGGSEGARRGPSMMPSGDEQAYAHVAPILSSAAASYNGVPCVDYLGKGGVGNYVKMVHNGIEYGLMQILAEAYDVMKRGIGLSNSEIKNVFTDWNHGRLHSYLVEILIPIFAARDEKTGGDLIDSILDRAKQKGTGKWTSQESFNVGEPTPTITSSVLARGISGLKNERLQAAQLFADCAPETTIDGDKQELLAALEQATYFAFLVTYTQGMALLKAASDEYGYDLNLEKVTTVWRSGCIVRASLLEKLTSAYQKQSDIKNLLLDDGIAADIMQTQAGARDVVIEATRAGIPTPCIGASLTYFDSYRCDRLPVNLIQAQRDLFGSHTFERVDESGVFHYNW